MSNPQEKAWADAEFDHEFEDENDEEFNQAGGGWEQSDEEDPFNDADPNGTWTPIADEDGELNDDPDAEIENEFWKGYYEKDDKQIALESFLKVLELINNGGNDTDDFKFKSLTEIVILYFQQHARAQTTEYFKQFLVCSKSAKPNDLSANLRKILNATKSDASVHDELHELAMQAFNPSIGGNEGYISVQHLWFDLGIERCHALLEESAWSKCQQLVDELHASLRSNGADDTSQTAKLLQVYAVKIQLSMCLIEDLARDAVADMDRYNALQFGLRELIEITRGLITNVDIIDNKSMSIIYECWAKVYASNDDWNNAYKYFKEAFLLYQQIAHQNTTKCLQYLLVSYMILSSLPHDDSTGSAQEDKMPNPFAMEEISVYQQHSQIVVWHQLVSAFDANDVFRFNKLSKQVQQTETDAFIARYLFAYVQWRLQGQALCTLVSSYDRVKLEWLCRKLEMKLDAVEKLIVKLIIDGELNARLDQVNMILILKEKESQSKLVLNSLSNWLKAVNNLRGSINGRAASKAAQSGAFGFGAFEMDYFHHDHDEDLFVIDSHFLSWD